MAWDDDLLQEQKIAAAHIGSHARLLAGPGTGKTLTMTRHICYLVSEKNVLPENILAITFTRAAARELRQRVERELGKGRSPRISTLHSFALRQLLRNKKRIMDLPQPLRIADDWEERNIIQEDLKSLLNLSHINEVKSLLNELSADWQSLEADKADWEDKFPNPEFIGAWREHRKIYGYTLRSELVYQLKKALEQRGDFELEGSIEHLIVDEYQDLNCCDLAVVREIASRNVELFIAGDDDQSIYGFRKAHPEGIRRFCQDYQGAKDLRLEICKRCAPKILELGLFVAKQDLRRIPKDIYPELGKKPGEVRILRFQNQNKEAEGIAKLCKYLINNHKIAPSDVLILIRSDNRGVFSELIRKEIQAADIPVAAATETGGPLDSNNGRTLLAFMRLAVNNKDSLAWRTLLQVWCQGIGTKTIKKVYDLARDQGLTFAEILLKVRHDDSILPNEIRNRLSGAISNVLTRLQEFPPGDTKYNTTDELLDAVCKASKTFVKDNKERNYILTEFKRAAESVDATSLEELVRATEVVSEDIEQEIDQNAVNILTMHKAKGLTAEAVIIAAAEDQYIPGRSQDAALDDERRLLYVSLTRAKHYLFITYCDKRTGSQKHTGRDSGNPNRHLTQFLRDCPYYKPEDGSAFLKRLASERQ